MRLIDADRLGREWNQHKTMIDNVDAQPTVDPVKHGHWIWTRNYTWHCSECGGLIATPGYMPTKDELPKRYRFCSQCGAKMDEVK